MFIEYKNGEKHAGSGADISESMDAFDDCGMLLSDDDVVIDIDHFSKDGIRAMIREFGLSTRTVWTERGAHLWFKKPAWFTRRTDGICRLGFEIEQHTKAQNPAGLTVKRNGVPRQIDNMEKQMYLPPMFKVDKGKRGKYEDLTKYGEGDGRNKALFMHKLTLQKHQAADIERIVSFINYHVLPDPLPPEELEHILRDTPVDDDRKGSEAIIADQIMSEYRTVYHEGMIWFFRNGRYTFDPKDDRLIRVIYEKCEGENTRYVDEIRKQIRYKSQIIRTGTVFPIRFRNGIIHKGSFIPMKDYPEFSPYYIDIEYNPDAPSVQIVDDYIDNLTGKDPEYRKLLMEVVGFVMVTDPEKIRSLGKFFMFRGDGANGKGTLLQIMKAIYNEENCTNLSIKQLADDRYKITMSGKLANLGDDIEPEAINNDQLKVIKNITTADTVATRHMYEESVSLTFTTKLYFTTNSDIKSFEKGYAYKRRVMWLPMFNKVERPDPLFITKITTKAALEYWIRLIVEGYQRLYKRNAWTECEAVETYNNQYHDNNDMCYQYAKDLDPVTELLDKTISEVRTNFEAWRPDDSKFISKNFKAAVWELYQIGMGKGKVGGITKRIFMKQGQTSQKLSH